MKINQLKIGIILSYLQMALSIVIGLFYTPIMLQMLGKSEYGLYNTVSATISMLSLLNLGFSSSYVRYYSQYKAKGDNRSIDKLNGLFLIIFGVIAMIALGCGWILSSHLELVFDEGLTEGEYRIAVVLMRLLSVNLAISFISTVFQCIISAHENFVFLKSVTLIRTVVSPLVTLPLLFLGFRSIGMVVVTLCFSVIADLTLFVFCLKKLKIRFVFHDFETGLFRSIFVFTGFLAINLIVDQVNSNMGKLLLARYVGTESVAVYSIGFLLYQYYVMFSTSISGVFTPRVHRLVQENEQDPIKRKYCLTELFVKVGRVQFLLLGLIASGVVLFGRAFIGFWAGEGYEDSYFVALLLILPASIALIQNVGIEIQRAMNLHKFRSIAYLIMAIFNLIISVYLSQAYGAVGAALGTAVSLILANGLIINIYYHKKCSVDIILFWKNILRQAVGIIPPMIAGFILCRFVKIRSLISMLACILIYCVGYFFSVYFLSMNVYEKSLVKNAFKKFVRKRDECAR